MRALALGDLRAALASAEHLPDDTPVRIGVDHQDLVVETAAAASLTIDGTSRGHTYQGVQHLRLHARPATASETSVVYAPAPGQDPDGPDDYVWSSS
ncbi:hypothetical protein [Nocardiopsis sp. RV163]|uniref:hypothetical protein n=1 Tax=Nocardiopsis sp. RV163 TaxID=1661388 RepID=UPI00064BDAB1|nr:hypothetical protein [Nocardiopsis sp. RV163]